VDKPKFEVHDKLGIGVFYKGEWQREFTIEAEYVRNQVEAFNDPMAHKSDYHAGIARLAKQIKKLGTIPRGEICVELLLDLHADDLEILQKVQKEVEEKIRFFRENLEAPADPAHSGGDEDRLVRGGAPGDAPGVS